jgi:hypothetical protein
VLSLTLKVVQQRGGSNGGTKVTEIRAARISFLDGSLIHAADVTGSELYRRRVLGLLSPVGVEIAAAM